MPSIPKAIAVIIFILLVVTVLSFLSTGIGGLKRITVLPEFLSLPSFDTISRTLFSRRIFTPPSSSQKPSDASSASPYQGRVIISGVYGYRDALSDEYVVIRHIDSNDQSPILLTGWSIENQGGSGASIPKISSSLLPGTIQNEDIMLPYGGTVILNSGSHNIGTGFRENACSGYLNEANVFVPSLGNACLTPSAADMRARGLSNECVDYIRRKPSCRTIAIPYPTSAELGSMCNEYVNNVLTYAGCVQAYQQTPNFLKNQWRVYLQRSSKLFERRGSAILKDAEGRVVSRYDYDPY